MKNPENLFSIGFPVYDLILTPFTLYRKTTTSVLKILLTFY